MAHHFCPCITFDYCRSLFHHDGSVEMMRFESYTKYDGRLINMSIDTKASVQKAFHDMAIQFLEASIGAWPEDTLLPLALVQVKGLSHADALKLFQDHIGPLADKLSKKDESALFQVGRHPELEALQIESKFSGANASTRETFWTYIQHLCRFGSMEKLYKHIPDEILGAVNEAAVDLKAQIDSGTLDASKVNPFELGQQVMSRFDANQIDKLMKTMMGSPEAVDSILNSMSSLVAGSGGPSMDAIGAAAAMLSGQGGPPNMASLGSLLSQNANTGLDLTSLLKFMPPK